MKNRLYTALFVMLFFFNVAGLRVIMPVSPESSLKSSAKIYAVFHGNTLFAVDDTVKDDKALGKAALSEKDKQCKERSALYKVMSIILIIWIGVSIYLFILNRKVVLLEKKIDEL